VKVPRLTSAARLAAIREEISDGALRLAYHAAVPVVIDPTLLNLLRVNFFLDPPDAVPHETEAALLLSPLFREIGEDLYEIEPDVRNLLLTGLYSRYGPERVRRIALLLEQYTDATLAWHAQPELERAQQLAALSFVDPALASQWLESAGSGSLPQALGREWYVAMQRRIADQSTVATASEEIARALNQLTHKDRRIREGAISTLAALTHLPETDPAPVVTTLTGFIRTGTRRKNPVTPDIQAALSLIGTLPHDDDLDFARITLIGADLGSLDFSKVDFSGAQLIGIKARGVNLTGTRLRNALIKDSVMDGARLDGASLRYAALEQVSLTGAKLVGVNMDSVRMQDVDLSRADLRNTRLVTSEADNVRLDGAMVDGAHIELEARSAEAAEGPESMHAVEEAVASGEPEATPRTFLTLGQSLVERGDLAGARAAYQRAIDSGDRDVALRAATGLGALCLRTGDYDEARWAYENALDGYRETGDRRGEGDALAGLGWADLETGQLDEAREHYEQAVRIFREVGDRHGEAETLTSLGLVNVNRGALDEAGRCFEQGLMLFRETGDRLGEGRALFYLGMVDARRGLFERAEEGHEQALTIFTELGDRSSQARALGELGIIDIQTGHRDRLIDRAEEALMIFRETGDNIAAAGLLRRMALAYQQAGDLDQAIRLYEQNSADSERTLGLDDPETQISQDYLTDLYRMAGQVDEALRLDESFFASRRENLGKDHPASLSSASSLAADLRALGRLDEALALDQETYDRRRRVLGEDHPDTQSSADRVATDLHALGEAPRTRVASPTVEDYFQAVQAPGLVFTVPELQTATFTVDSFGLPKAASGRSAVVFQAAIAGRLQAVRCYTRNHASGRERYVALGAYLASHDLSPYVSATTWLDSAIRVNGTTWPVLLMDWIDGQNLHQYVRFLVQGGRIDALVTLSQQWRELIHTLQQAEFAHGGLEHDDVMVDGEGQLRLVGYDLIWIPSIQDLAPPSEPSHRNYEHPGGRVWGRWMDTFPALVIYVSLVALAKDPALWAFHAGDNLLFYRSDFLPPFETPLWRKLAALQDPEINKLVTCLQECCAPDWVADKSLDSTINQA
jgi:tetratricopeptide (TPR) repeat protein